MSANLLRRIALSLAAIAILALPAAADGEVKNDLIGTKWQLTVLNGNVVEPGTKSTLNVSANGVGGNGGCNTYGGDLTVTGTAIDIANVFSTMMACEGLPQEQAYFAALEASQGYVLADGSLKLIGDEGVVLAEFVPAS